MKLEFIYHPAKTGLQLHPMLFVHGMSHAAWCWEEEFIPYFTALGYDCYALSLRGHGASEGAERLRWSSIKEYEQDVEWAIRKIGKLPIVFGHSMGGFILQKYILKHDILPAYIGVAAVPNTGMLRGALNLLSSYPWAFLMGNLTLSTLPFVQSEAIVRDMCLTPGASTEKVREVQSRLQGESYRAFLDMVLLNHHAARKVDTPMLHLHTTLDKVLFEPEMRACAEKFGADYHQFSNVGHDMFLDDNWREVADYISAWLTKKGL
jgi:pimeloyl-ACP methyl ester carboxylesterase